MQGDVLFLLETVLYGFTRDVITAFTIINKLFF